MIKPNELRIGNLVFNRHGEIHEITYNCFTKFFHPTMDGNPSGFRPIPITEEWLKKFGFEDLYYHEDKFGWIKGGVNISKHFNFVLMLPNAEYYDSTKIKWVHQLQNLYFALTSEELELKESNP